MKKTVSHLLIQALLGLGFCHTVQAAVSVEPSIVASGKATEVLLRFDRPETIHAISLQPGSPYLIERIGLADGQAGYNTVRRDNGLYLRDGKNNVLAFFGKEGSTSNGLFNFVAAAEDGLRIYKEHDRQNPVGVYPTSTPALDVSVSGGLAFVATGDGGLSVLNVEKPEMPLWLGSHQKLGHAIKVSAEGRRVAVLNDAGRLFLIDANNPSEPTTITAYRSETPLLDIALSGKRLFALGSEQIQVIDVSAETPQLSNEGLDFGQGVNLGGERRVFIDNSLAYVADWFSGIHIYDLSRPRQPELLSSFHTPGSPKGIVVRDGIAFVADDDHGLQILDVSDPLEPKQISTLLTNGLAYTPRLAGDLLYLASHRGGFQIIDVSDIHQPRLLSEYDTPGKAWSMEVHGTIAYVADDDSGLLMFDVADPAKPELIGQYFTGAAAEEVSVRDNIAFVAFFDDGLHILDIADPRQPKLLGRLALPGNSRGLDLIGDRLYVAGWLAGVQVVDVSDLSQPRLLGSYDTRGATWGVKALGEQLYAMDWWGGVSVIDVSDPSRPQAVGGYHNRGHVHDIEAQGNYTFVAQGSNGLQVFDIKNPLNPTWTTGVAFPGQARQVALQGERAYVAAADGGLAIVDIRNPFHLRWLASVDSRGEAFALAVDDHHIYLLDDREGVIVLALGGNAPRKVTSLHIDANALWLHDGTLYLATGHGIEVARLDQEQRLTIVERLAIAGGAQKISGDGERLYVASADTLLTLALQTPLSPSGRLDIKAPINDLKQSDAGLLLSTPASLLLIGKQGTQIDARYALLGHGGNLLFHQGIVYIGGEETITALRPLPPLRQEINAERELRFALPASLAEGSYNLRLQYKDGSEEIIHNAIRIEMPKFSKPKMSMEEFKKLLQQQQQNSDLFTAPNAKE